MTRYAVLSLLIIGCGDLPHDNALDIDNADGEAEQVVVAEDFTIKNTKPNVIAPLYNQNSQDALYELTDTYGPRLLILEYHMTPQDTNFADSLGTPDNETRYSFEYKGGSARGFPHTFFNGKQLGIQGASSSTTARNRYKAVIEDSITAKKVKLFCDVRKTISGSSLTIRATVARYGEEDLNDVKIEYVIFEDKGEVSGKFCVRKVLAPEIVNLPAGVVTELNEQTTSISGYVADKVGVVMILKANASKKILQANLAH